jgi:hypothetical protein
MNNVFKPCAGKNVCIENKTHCLSCGRKLETIAKTRKLIEALANLALEEGYNNAEEFMEYIGRKAGKMVQHQQSKDQAI